MCRVVAAAMLLTMPAASSDIAKRWYHEIEAAFSRAPVDGEAADPLLLVGMERELAAPKLIAFLESQRGEAIYSLAVPGVSAATPFILVSGMPVMPLSHWQRGGAILSVQQFAGKVAAGELRFALLSDNPNHGFLASPPLDDWIRTHGRVVDPALWRPDDTGAAVFWRLALVLYDLRPATDVGFGMTPRR